VSVDGAKLRLRGHVSSWAERDLLAQVARSTQGVGELVNDLVVVD
jgi:osmotically-inducible protein OsmY